MNDETIENPGIVMESNTDNTNRIIRIEACMVSIRAASWLTAIGVLALVVTQVV